DVSTSNANFTNSFTAPRNKQNIRTLEGLSLPSSRSDIPYRRVNSALTLNGIDIVRDGWLQVKEADRNNFKISVLDGNVNFWKAIEGLTLADIDLSEADHDKNINSVIDSFSNPYYKYILGDYGGQTSLEDMRFNID